MTSGARPPSGQPLAPLTNIYGLFETRAVLRAALGRVVKDGRIERNRATMVDLLALIKKERKVFTPQEVRQFCDQQSP